MGVPQIANPAQAYGFTDLQTSLFRVGAPVKAAANIAAGRVVAIGTQGTVTTALTNAPSLAIGIATEAITSGRTGEIIVLGIAEGVGCNGAIAAGDIVKASVTTAGYVAATATPAAGEAIGIAIAASASNLCNVWVIRSL